MRERYIFRPTVLRSFGWKIIDVLSHDWLRDPQDVLNRIEALLRGEEAPALPESQQAVTLRESLGLGISRFKHHG